MKKLWSVPSLEKELGYSREALYTQIRRGSIKVAYSEPIYMIRDAEVRRVKKRIEKFGKWRAFKNFKPRKKESLEQNLTP